VLEGLSIPMLETDQQWSMYGFTFPNYLAELGATPRRVPIIPSLDKAMRDAFRKLRRFSDRASHERGRSDCRDVGAADFGVTQVVDATGGVHGSIPKECLYVHLSGKFLISLLASSRDVSQC